MERRMDSGKADLASVHCLARNYLVKKEESLIWKPTEHFLIMWKAFTDLKETNCLKYYKEKCSQFIIEKCNRNLL